MPSSWRTKVRILAHVLFAPGFWDSLSGRLAWDRRHRQPVVAAPPLVPTHRELKGAVHVHTCTYSDGLGTVEDVMDAARAAGIDFVYLADHNTMGALRDNWPDKYTRKPPYLLVADEITVAGGRFLLAFSLPGTFDFPVWRPTSEALAAVQDAGGHAFVSLPFDMKHPWEDWDVEGFEGLEVLNLSTVARGHINLLSLAWLIPLWKRKGVGAVLEAIAARPDAALRRWDQWLAQGRTSVGIGALDAHAQMKVLAKKVPLPTYEQSFRAVTTHVWVRPDATDPCVAIADALRRGCSYFAYDNILPDGCLLFQSSAGAMPGEDTRLGDELRVEAPAGVFLRLISNGRTVCSSRTGRLSWTADRPGAYRVEAYRPGRWFGCLGWNVRPWAFSNPIYVGRDVSSATRENPPQT